MIGRGSIGYIKNRKKLNFLKITKFGKTLHYGDNLEEGLILKRKNTF